MQLDRKTLAYRLGVTIELIGEEIERGPAANQARLQGLLRMARADVSAMAGDGPARAAVGPQGRSRPTLRLVHGGRGD